MLLQPDIENSNLTSGSEDNRQMTIIPQNESMIKKHMNSVTKLKLKGVTLKGASRGAAVNITQKLLSNDDQIERIPSE